MCSVFTATLTLDDQFFCLFTSINGCRADRGYLCLFLFVGDLNGHHQEWLGSTTTNRHGVAAFDFATVSGCDQLVVGPTHARGGTLDLLMTDVPDLVWVTQITPLCWHSFRCLRRYQTCWKVFLKHQVNWNTVCGAIQDLPWRNIWHADNRVEVLHEHLLLLVGCMYQPRSSVCVTRISPGLMINTGMLSASSRRLIFGGPVIAFWLTGKSLSAVK